LNVTLALQLRPSVTRARARAEDEDAEDVADGLRSGVGGSADRWSADARRVRRRKMPINSALLTRIGRGCRPLEGRLHEERTDDPERRKIAQQPG